LDQVDNHFRNLRDVLEFKGDTMNIKCAFCQTPYTLSRIQMIDALQKMDAEKLTHYDAHCPRCRRATRVERKRVEMFFPNWREALKQLEVEMQAHPQPEALSAVESRPDAAKQKEPKKATPQPAPKRTKKTKSAAENTAVKKK